MMMTKCQAQWETVLPNHENNKDGYDSFVCGRKGRRGSLSLSSKGKEETVAPPESRGERVANSGCSSVGNMQLQILPSRPSVDSLSFRLCVNCSFSCTFPFLLFPLPSLKIKWKRRKTHPLSVREVREMVRFSLLFPSFPPFFLLFSQYFFPLPLPVSGVLQTVVVVTRGRGKNRQRKGTTPLRKR